MRAGGGGLSQLVWITHFDIVHAEDAATVVHVLLQILLQVLEYERQRLFRVYDIVQRHYIQEKKIEKERKTSIMLARIGDSISWGIERRAMKACSTTQQRERGGGGLIVISPENASLHPSLPPSYRRRRRTRNQLGRMRSRLSLDRSTESKGGHVTPLHPLFPFFFLSCSAQSMNDKSSPEKERHLINYRLQ